jgi:hypothetical protein
MSPRGIMVLLLGLCAAACGAGEVGRPGGPRSSNAGALPSDPALVTAYLRFLSPALVGRVLSDAELDQVEAEAGAAIEPILSMWAAEEGFVAAARIMVETNLTTSGQRGGIDYDLPGNLVTHVVLHGKPWSEVLTSDTCYSATDEPIPCDSGAPYEAGVLSTRGFLAATYGRFNLTRSRAMLRTFACRDYPQEDDLQPRIERDRLLVMFRADTPEEQEVAEAAGGFGNGFACYTCHGQFAVHAQLFVKFDNSGLWHGDATGLQNPDDQPGNSFNGTATSHMIDPNEAASERSQMFGEPVENLRSAAQVMAWHPVFLDCAARSLLDHALRLDTARPVRRELLQSIRDMALDRASDPSLADLMIATFAHPEVVDATLAQLGP